jgi:hypothetical protein
MFSLILDIACIVLSMVIRDDREVLELIHPFGEN